MMAQQILFALHQRGVVVQAQDGELVITGNTDSLTEQDIVTLKDNKGQLLTLLGGDDKAPLKFVSRIGKVGVDGDFDGDSYELSASNLQRNIFFLESLSQGQHFYNVPSAFRLHGEVNEQALSKAIAALCEKFDILRTVYQYQNDELMQVVEPYQADKVPFSVEAIDAQNMAECLKAEANFDFDLSKQWPIKVVLFKSQLEQILTLTIHHIAIDGYSAKLITSALAEAYQLFSDNPQAQISALESNVFNAPQYGDYALWHQDYLQSDACQDARQYWAGLLKDAPSCHNFPLEFARPSTLSVEGDTLVHHIEGELFSRIKQAATQKNVSVFMLLQAMFAGFMARFGDEEDIVIGSVYANRSPKEFMQSIGMFANTIPFRYRFNESTDIGHLIADTQSQHYQALHHQQLPFDMMLEGLNVERSGSYNPLVQVQFVLQEDALNDFTLKGLDVQAIVNAQAVAKFDFSVHVFVKHNQVKLHWEYNSNLFSRERADELLHYFVSFVSHHVSHEFDKVLRYQFADIASQTSCLEQPAQSPKALGCEKYFAPFVSNPELIEQYAFSQPNAIAVTQGNERLTYAQLVIKANTFIAGLQQQGIEQGQAVAVYMDKSIDQVIAMYGVMRAGFVYVPLDANYPEQRLAYICENSGAKAIVCAQTLRPAASICGDTSVVLFEQLVSCEAATVLPQLEEQHPAYIIYTSGSTGKPKGVIVPHGSIYYSLQANRQVFDFTANDTMPTVGSQAFGVSLLETFVPLISGGTVQTIQSEQVADINLLIEATEQASVIHFVPSLMAQWLDVVEHDSSLYPNLRLLLVGAEPVPPILLTRLKAWRADVAVRVLYGMTESSVVSSSYAADEHDGHGYSVGKPHPNMQFYCVNRFGVVQPVGVPGELYVGGLSLASGYVGLAALTAEKFAHHKVLNQRLYKTGDRARLLSSGHFEFLGRVDHQVSLRGIRIETGEIESLVNNLDVVKKCIAHVVSLNNGDSKFVLYYTRYHDDLPNNAGSQVDSTAIKALIKETLIEALPESMCPSVFVELDTFPHNPNGKVDRNKLPKPESTSQYIEPQSSTERFLQKLWSEMLELERVSVLDNFFELGGHSLMATKLLNQINQHYNINMPLKLLFTASTIRDCSALIDKEVEHQQLGQLLGGGNSPDEQQIDEQEFDEFVI